MLTKHQGDCLKTNCSREPIKSVRLRRAYNRVATGPHCQISKAFPEATADSSQACARHKRSPKTGTTHQLKWPFPSGRNTHLTVPHKVNTAGPDTVDWITVEECRLQPQIDKIWDTVNTITTQQRNSNALEHTHAPYCSFNLTMSIATTGAVYF